MLNNTYNILIDMRNLNSPWQKAAKIAYLPTPIGGTYKYGNLKSTRESMSIMKICLYILFVSIRNEKVSAESQV